MFDARRYVILDRDGTLNVERNYLSDPEGVELLPKVPEALAYLRSLDFGLVVITNQSGLARGYFDRPTLDAIHHRLASLLAEHGGALDGIYVCPHMPNAGCACRKPAVGLVRQAEADLGFDARRSFVIGDNVADIEIGKALGAPTILVMTGYGRQVAAEGKTQPDFCAEDLLEAAAFIEACLSVVQPVNNSRRG